MNKFKKINKIKMLISKFPTNSLILALIGLLLFASGIILLGINISQIALLVVAFFLLLYSAINTALFINNKDDELKKITIKEREIFRELKKSEALLDVGKLCSWQYSINAGILKFDASQSKLLGATKSYYVYEELERNRHIKRIIKHTCDKNLLVIDDEVYFPFINKWVIVRGKCIGVEAGGIPNQFIGVLIDNTERKEILKHVEEISVTDDLTGLKNRKYFFEKFNREISLFQREKSVFSVALLDIDFFKKINDNFGHLAGDYVLKKFAELLLLEVRPYDIVGRFGGEEFIILFPNINKAEATKIVNRIRFKVFKNSYEFNNIKIPLSFSCGVGDVSEIELYTDKEFISIIDKRLYEAKKLGRNLVISGG